MLSSSNIAKLCRFEQWHSWICHFISCLTLLSACMSSSAAWGLQLLCFLNETCFEILGKHWFGEWYCHTVQSSFPMILTLHFFELFYASFKFPLNLNYSDISQNYVFKIFAIQVTSKRIIMLLLSCFLLFANSSIFFLPKIRKSDFKPVLQQSYLTKFQRSVFAILPHSLLNCIFSIKACDTVKAAVKFTYSRSRFSRHQNEQRIL